MHRKLVEVVEVDPAKFDGFVVEGKLTAEQPHTKAHRELLPNLTIVVRDHVPRIAVNPDQTGWLDIESGLLADLPDDALRECLANLEAAARKSPQPVVSTLFKQHLTGVVRDYSGRSHHD